MTIDLMFTGVNMFLEICFYSYYYYIFLFCFRLACFERSGLFTTQSSLVSSATKHYKWQVYDIHKFAAAVPTAFYLNYEMAVLHE